MKGPGLRTDLDVRRVWSCPKCGRITRTAGRVTAQRCPCVSDGQWMQLQPPVKREPFRPPPREPDARELADEAPEGDGNLAGEAPREAAGILAESVIEPVVTVEDTTTIEVQVVVVNEKPVVNPAPPVDMAGAPEEGADDGFGAGIADAPAAD